MLDVYRLGSEVFTKTTPPSPGEASDYFSFRQAVVMQYAAAEYLIDEYGEDSAGIAREVVIYCGVQGKSWFGEAALSLAQRSGFDDGSGVVLRIIEYLGDLDSGPRRNLEDLLRQHAATASFRWLTEQIESALSGPSADLSEYAFPLGVPEAWSLGPEVPASVRRGLEEVRDLLRRSAQEPELVKLAVTWGWATLENFLAHLLLEESDGASPESFPMGWSVVLKALERGYVSEEDVSSLRTTWALRNQVAHGSVAEELDPQVALKAVRTIFQVISGHFRRVVVRNLMGKNG
jgi:hypothetical protein